MKCPHCNYLHGWNPETLSSVDGYLGNFYRVPIRLERNEMYTDHSCKDIYGCPQCNKLFMD